MRAKLLYLFSGVLLAAVVLVGAGLLRAQSTYTGPKYEYAWVYTGSESIAELPVKDAAINGVALNFKGNTFELFDVLGAQGYEYVGQNGSFNVFKKLSAP